MIEAQPDIAGSIVQPVTDAEKASTAAFLNSVAAIIASAAEGWRIVGIAKADCPH